MSAYKEQVISDMNPQFVETLPDDNRELIQALGDILAIFAMTVPGAQRTESYREALEVWKKYGGSDAKR